MRVKSYGLGFIGRYLTTGACGLGRQFCVTGVNLAERLTARSHSLTHYLYHGKMMAIIMA